VHQPVAFNAWVARLTAASNIDVSSFDDFLAALKSRHDYFHQTGARLSDHGLEFVPADFIDDASAAAIFAAARAGQAASEKEHRQFSTYMLQYFARLDAEKGWTKQFHVGVLRNNNTRLFESRGRDLGCDSIADSPQARSLGAFLDRLDRDGALPKTIVYNLNPADNYVFATMLGNFQDGVTAGKLQMGSGWWYLDQQEGMEWQMNCLSNTGLLSRFVGMLTDSRSFMSFTRHEYFRRILCDLIGRDVEAGRIPADDSLVGPMVENICYGNAKHFLGIG
jgi:glucuronate isomerase